MNSLILQTVARNLLRIMLLFSLWVLLRGHNAPGGGFIAGLLAAAAMALYLLAYGIEAVQKLIIFSSLWWAALGLFLMVLSGIWGMLVQQTFLKGVWLKGMPEFVNSPLLFDIGVYLCVGFAVLTILIALEKSQ
ncbi:MAG: Na(+)/H(+) antiporter subunit B [Legionellaceae bacterium]|nr:Na(+)/H(+) antiporter subunit B [Legionellaceae bacterium]